MSGPRPSPTVAHRWDIPPADAQAIQTALAGRVERANRLPDPLRRVAGVDVGFEDDGWVTRAAVAVLSFPQLDLIESAIARRPTTFPYRPGLLSFRELPAVLEALAALQGGIDLLLCDGQGIAHPRRCGLASHLGVLVDRPSIGVGKSRLLGRFTPPGPPRGDWSPLLDGDETIGAVLRTRRDVSPLFVSIGHRVDLPTAVDLVLACAPRYRLPETTRQAHRLASGGSTAANGSAFRHSGR